MTEPRTPHLDAACIRQLAQRHEIGGHSATHRSLLAGPREPAEAYRAALEAEIPASKSALEATLARPVTAFAYPRGETDARVEDEVRRAGFALAYTTEPGYLESGTAALAIPRYQLNHNTPLSWVQDHMDIPRAQRDHQLLLEGSLAMMLLLYQVLPDRSKRLI
jgi:peptidoglycan/xylan/chitin deacetylase (PgdA/CDA1 family)